jgi:hypothetical protein
MIHKLVATKAQIALMICLIIRPLENSKIDIPFPNRVAVKGGVHARKRRLARVRKGVFRDHVLRRARVANFPFTPLGPEIIAIGSLSETRSKKEVGLLSCLF